MEIIINPPRAQWNVLVQRPYADNTSVREAVQVILNGVRQHGDEALRSFTKKFDGVELADFKVSPAEFASAPAQLTEALRNAIDQAISNITAFHAAQLKEPQMIETMPGVTCWRRSVGIEKVGLYVPGGTAPLFSTVLMLAIPARLAGCTHVSLCTPCDRNGQIHPAILYAASKTGVSTIYKLGGAQAIAAMAYGTGTVAAVHKIFGPGNQYVTAAKQLVQMEGLAIDMPAGPSEVCVLADGSADPRFVAADLLSQAEHGADSQVLLVCHDAGFAEACMKAAMEQLGELPRKEVAQKALSNSRAVVLPDLGDAMDLVNAYAPEHLIVAHSEEAAIMERVVNAGSVFLGAYSPESAGDYASGTNHTLPTNGFARAWSGVSVDSFVKKITFQKLTREGLNAIGHTVIEMAEAEGLRAHANAVRIRLTSTPNA